MKKKKREKKTEKLAKTVPICIYWKHLGFTVYSPSVWKKKHKKERGKNEKNLQKPVPICVQCTWSCMWSFDNQIVYFHLKTWLVNKDVNLDSWVRGIQRDMIYQWCVKQSVDVSVSTFLTTHLNPQQLIHWISVQAQKERRGWPD